MADKEIIDKKKNVGQKPDQGLIEKPPVVVVLGHVDHGKTSLLDYIRKTKVTAGESGGITQHIGAYQVNWRNKKITFIDTPGHEAFSSMRSRGAQAADLAILVVAADDGVKPQTKEAIKFIQENKIPLIVAINKIDLPSSQPEKVKQELLEEGIAVEGYGGDTPVVEVSAKTGQNIDDLLEMILLVAEMQELKFDPQAKVIGVIIEAVLDRQQGPLATLLIKNGYLKTGDIISSSMACGKIKRMDDFMGHPIKLTDAGSPVEVMGFNDVPMVGDVWEKVDDLKTAEKKIKEKLLHIKESSTNKSRQPIGLDQDSEQKRLEIILKADCLGTLEAIKKVLDEVKNEEVELKVLASGVGEINENDIKLASINQAKVFGFRVKDNSSIQKIVERYKIEIITAETIYDLIQKVRTMLVQMEKPKEIKELVGQMKILAVFKKTKGGQIIGGRVISGKVIRGGEVEVFRNDGYLDVGKIVELEHNKKPINEVVNGQECGILCRSNAEIKVDDTLKIYEVSLSKNSVI